MASTTAFFTGLTGLTANARNLDVIGNNISNVNTTAFKSSRMMFATQFSRTVSSGTAPSTNTGGTNPNQIGLGVTIAGTQRNFNTGSVSPTGDPRDLAIDGNGFFVVNRAGANLYTRAGAFRQNTNNDLVTISGERVQGFAVDSDFNVIRGVLSDINIPVGQLTIAEQTRTSRISGNLNSSGSVPTRGSITNFGALAALPSASPAPGAGNVLEATTRLVDIADPSNSAAPLFNAGQIVEINGVKKGTQNIPTAQLTVTSTTTVQDYLDFLQDTLNINTTVGNNPDGSTPGITLNATTGVISVTGNVGTANSIDLDSTNVILRTGTTASRTPLTATTAQEADGESVLTSFVAFDSLGNQVTVNLRVVLESKTGGNGTTWRFFAESPDHLGPDNIVGTGTLSFNNQGDLTSASAIPLTIDRNGSGAVSPMSFDMIFGGSGGVTARSAASNIASLSQDGAPNGTLQSFAVGQDGIITGGFSNGLTRTLGQIAIATFSNPEGLLEVGGTMFTPGPNAGEPLITQPLELGSGKIVGGALELSNVDLSQEFINLILASTGYSASSRVITTTDQLMQQLLAIGR